MRAPNKFCLVIVIMCVGAQCQEMNMTGNMTSPLRMLRNYIEYSRKMYLYYRDEMDMMYCVLGGFGNIIKKRVPRPKDIFPSDLNSPESSARASRKLDVPTKTRLEDLIGGLSSKVTLLIPREAEANGDVVSTDAEATLQLPTPRALHELEIPAQMHEPELRRASRSSSTTSDSSRKSRKLALQPLHEEAFASAQNDKARRRNERGESGGKGEEKPTDLPHPSRLASLLGVTRQQFTDKSEPASGASSRRFPASSYPRPSPSAAEHPPAALNQTRNAILPLSRTKRHTMMEEMAFDMLKDNPLVVAVLKMIGAVVYFGQLLGSFVESSILLSCSQKYLYRRSQRWVGLI